MTVGLALSAALNAVWAMEPSALENLLEIAARTNEVTPEALEAYRAENLARAERAKVRDGVAVIEADGPLFKRANMFAAMSGATSYEVMRRDFQTALDDPKVKAILFNVNSPGGEVAGTGELAQAIFDARGKKPLAAYVSGTSASAAYWITSAVDPGNVVIDASAILGSLGVQLALKESAPKAGEKSYRFVSSQSPMKNADPGSEDGAAALQGVVDALASVFVETVARNRGTSVQTVLSDFGKGGIFVGRDAVKAGLADRTGSFEGVLAELSARKPGDRKGKTIPMTNTSTLDPAISASIDRALAAQRLTPAPSAASIATVAPIVPVQSAAELAAAAEEARQVEEGEMVASICGNPNLVEEGRKQRAAARVAAQAEAKAAATAAIDEAEFDAIAARIGAA